MLDAEGMKNMFGQIHKLWIEPEVNRRQEAGKLPDGFKIYRCLIRLPQNRPPIVEFNDEIGWVAEAEPAPDKEWIPGQPVYLHDIQKITAVQPPEVDGVRVAFVFLFWVGKSYSIMFDFTPNWPDGSISDEEKEEWSYGKVIAEYLQSLLTEQVIHVHDKFQQLLQKIGLWAAPALLPYPLNKIINRLEENDLSGARAVLVGYCTPSFLKILSSKWWDLEHFTSRKSLIEEALFAHEHGKYGLSIHTLLPQLEGIITDYITTKLPPEEIPWRQESKTKKFRDLVIENPPSTLTYRRIVESTMDFILEGPEMEMLAAISYLNRRGSVLNNSSLSRLLGVAVIRRKTLLS
ncbi:MAG TPA: hypothetical protein VF656_20640 [Pyrinomonadaceae bacterium]|jgi:hypothetical protein